MARQKENNTALFVALASAALLLVAAIVGMKFVTRQPPPVPAATGPEVRPINTPMMYRGVLDEDARRFGVAATSPEELARPLEHVVELDAPRPLRPGESFETEHLRIGAQVVKAWAKSEGGQGFRYDHLVVTITNKADAPLAYRVDTVVPQPDKCRSQGAFPHNALALQPGEKAERTECLHNPGMLLTVTRVETLQLPPIGYFYVSRLVPQQIGLDQRTAAGHVPPKDLTLCKYVPWRDIETSGATWADVIDFYARHNCDEYSFFRGYRRRTVALPLPASDNGAVGDGGSS